MTSHSETRALTVAIETAKQAGALVLEGFRHHAHIEKKGPTDLVTEYDLKAERFISDALRKEFPSIEILGEEVEKGDISGAAWVIDPIDGTTNFAHGHPFFCISIALCYKGDPVVGVVHAPALGITWSAQKDKGSYRNEQACAVSKCTELSEALCATGFPYDRRESSEDNLKEFAAFLKTGQGMRRCGSAALDLAFTADGTFDLYWEQKLKPWDFAAGLLLVKEAGGIVTDYEGHTASLKSSRLLASNPTLHPLSLNLLTQARKSDTH
ncbi:MAG: inositol monophosphatase [Myxococcales bacterium]|nr:MAG: inositol monophosphatase [Myxococcales bacterium]